MPNTDTLINDNNNNVGETIRPLIFTSQDTNIVSETGATVISETDMPRVNQPNGWLQLLLPIFIALFVVFVDKWVTRYYNHKDEKNARKQFRDTVLDWIVKIEPIEKLFSKSVHDLANEIQTSDVMQPVAYAMPLTLHDKMNDMSVEKMTEAFIKDFKDESNNRYANMYNIISNFQYLSKITESVRQSYESYYKQSFSLCQEWNGLYETFMEKYHTLENDNPYSTVITVWFAQLLKTPNSVQTHIKALDALCLLAFNNEDFEMMSLASKMRNIVIQSQTTSVGFAKVFSDTAENIDITLKSLSNAERFFRKGNLDKKQNDG